LEEMLILEYEFGKNNFLFTGLAHFFSDYFIISDTVVDLS
jgi:hypothetical protein